MQEIQWCNKIKQHYMVLKITKWVVLFFKLTHANVIFAAIAPDVVGHLKPLWTKTVTYTYV